MKILPHLFTKLFCSQLMLHEPTRHSFERHLLSHMQLAPAAPVAAAVLQPQQQQQQIPGRVARIYSVLDNVAIVQIHGVIDKMVDSFDLACYGGCDLADVDQALSLAANDSKVDTVLLWIESPGGSVTGTPETAARVADLAKTKEVHAYTSTLCCSTAYYIASQADFISASKSAIVGSIGVYMALLDESKALEMEGYKVELIKAGKLKAMGASFKPLSDEERAFLQAGVDQTYAEFKRVVTSTRKKVSDDTMQGQWFTGSDSLKLGLVDEASNLSIDDYASKLLLR